MKLKAVLFDLDDTLLVNDMARFGPAFYDLIGGSLKNLVDPVQLTEALSAAIGQVLDHDDPLITNEQCFWQTFTARVRVPEDQLRQSVARFYAASFPQLQSLTRPRAEARNMVELARTRGLKTALATNPMFPETAILQRLAWGGLSADGFDYVTTLENSYTCKPHAAYFAGIVQRLDVRPGEALMIGDNWRLDIAPAIGLGLKTFWLNDRDRPHPIESPAPTAAGSWAEFVIWWQASTLA